MAERTVGAAVLMFRGGSTVTTIRQHTKGVRGGEW